MIELIPAAVAHWIFEEVRRLKFAHRIVQAGWRTKRMPHPPTRAELIMWGPRESDRPGMRPTTDEVDRTFLGGANPTVRVRTEDGRVVWTEEATEEE